MPEPTSTELHEVLSAYGRAAARVEPLAGGLIHRTYAVAADDGAFVLQRVNPIFAAAVHHNIAAATEHLRSRGVAAPQLLASSQGRAWYEDADGGVWRLMTRLAGRPLAAVEHVNQARALGEGLGRFHAALADCSHAFRVVRGRGHDRERHLTTLRQALAEHGGHRLYGPVQRVVAQLMPRVEAMPPLSEEPDALGHGDPKLANVLFDADGPGATATATATVVGLVDLDTVGPVVLAFELGDAWRSWCLAGTDDDAQRSFSMPHFEMAWHGWLAHRHAPLSTSIRAALLDAPEWIALELAIRFAADALLETYFGWDAQRYGSAGDHNLARAKGQLGAHEAIRACRPERARVLGLAPTS